MKDEGSSDGAWESMAKDCAREELASGRRKGDTWERAKGMSGDAEANYVSLRVSEMLTPSASPSTENKPLMETAPLILGKPKKTKGSGTWDKLMPKDRPAVSLVGLAGAFSLVSWLFSWFFSWKFTGQASSMTSLTMGATLAIAAMILVGKAAQKIKERRSKFSQGLLVGALCTVIQIGAGMGEGMIRMDSIKERSNEIRAQAQKEADRRLEEEERRLEEGR